MMEVTKYSAYDGIIFDSKDECIRYEVEYIKVKGFLIKCFRDKCAVSLTVSDKTDLSYYTADSVITWLLNNREEIIKLLDNKAPQLEFIGAPEWVRWYAIDADGKAHWFKNKPIISEDAKAWDTNDEYQYIKTMQSFKTHWKDSLIERI